MDDRQRYLFDLQGYDAHPIAWSARFYDRSRFAGLSPRQCSILEPPNARYGGRPTA